MGSEELDKILDSALASYSQEEPRPGLDGRVLNRIRAAGEVRRLAWLRWMVAIPVFASFLLLVFWISDSSKPARSTFRASTEIRGHAAFQNRDRQGAVNRPQTHGARVAGSRPSAKHLRLRLPKREQFPTPTPLTAEERALLAFVGRLPKQAQEVLADARSRSAEPIEIKEVHIEPLQSSGQ
ncbi:MAG: hypothetical protein ACR2JB_02715 [Bryobacteraceae bacterium]